MAAFYLAGFVGLSWALGAALTTGALGRRIPLTTAYLVSGTLSGTLVTAVALLERGEHRGLLTIEHPVAGVGPAAAAVIGIGLGVALFGLENAAAAWTANRWPGPGSAPVEGISREIPDMVGSLPLVFACLVATALFEEILWRGVLVVDLRGDTIALAVAAAAFGLVHFYGGARNVVVKAIEAGAWTAAFLGTGSIICPAVSHVTLNLMIFVHQYRGRGDTAGADRPGNHRGAGLGTSGLWNGGVSRHEPVD